MVGDFDSRSAARGRKAAEWRRRMVRFQTTRSSVAQFCRDEGVSPASFYQWRKKLAEPPQAEVRSLVAEGHGDHASDFTPVRLIGSAGVAVELPGGTQFSIPTSDPQTLQLAIRTLAQADADRAGGDTC